jgi:hypothetical protein
MTMFSNTPKNDDLNDSLADLIGNVDVQKAANPVEPPKQYRPIWKESCRKCGGSGQYRAPSMHGSRCFACKGMGKLVFKTSPEHRAKAKASTAARAQEAAHEAAQAAAAWLAANPAIAAWFIKNGENDFARSLFAGLNRYGALTDGQKAAVERSIARDAERATEAAQRVENAPKADTAGVDRLTAAFDKAKAYASERGRGIRGLRLTIGGMVISPAGVNSKNPGALYVKNGETYLGKIQTGKFFGSRECTEAAEKRLLAFVADPKAAAKAYGQETGICCVCNAQLTNEDSIEAGIGPICAEKFGW